MNAPRFLAEGEAAKALGLPLATFRALVESRQLPGPVPQVGLFDAKALDAACDRLSGIGSPQTALDAWRERKHGPRAA